ncbi:MAG: hypothetical protein A3E07_03825 [Candidatus Wildermuthbacteria bacterium RIFCSPHIGHO2_12_FULL_45_9]|uniref:DNA recombination protein RmuC n=1 Tax=Candidatus Wildermuthbacteria bacterium RIFCSPHIGHO2_02_FULL_45_25 TaxID=1802450 RepID=A0A1G2R4P7_9BACT|nr:MAG: hypothetical protein A2748_02320 [Candidatus Wildermuthbacteria bacterium RIFCSPHIGHO2_01_FULL_45_20]OHA67222.1 MAG: hypothetical protein A3C04_01665 [Candidatus Wildermuthbacteria bacterium RIFCSPHIGHO2_02_FULL_45_25]OHA71895.1 MAG: hypothetical protein A3E07_03825 [Candidatus Wildermuthbacteria bacterium RIFCSPHIGHO2_12_FULL_45_9]
MGCYVTSMENILFFAALGIFSIVLIAFILRFRKIEQKPKEDGTGMILIQNQIAQLRVAVDEKLGSSTKMFQEQYGQSAQLIKDITEKLTRLDETNKQVVGFADQLQDLGDILKNPKHRGILGEYYLETVLKNVLPPKHYQLQYQFPNGEIVDAVIFVKDKIIPIDAKFSLENYNRILQEKDETEKQVLEKKFKEDLKTRIDETAKYIRPENGTMEFAFMFIPAEGIYYDLLVNQVGALKTNTRDLIEYAQRDKRVIIVSPTSFFAYLQTVLQGLRALQIEESAKEIRKRVEQLAQHLIAYDIYLKKLGNHLGTAVNTYNTTYKEFGKINKDVMRITEQPNEVEVLQIAKPEEQD